MNGVAAVLVETQLIVRDVRALSATVEQVAGAHDDLLKEVIGLRERLARLEESIRQHEIRSLPQLLPAPELAPRTPAAPTADAHAVAVQTRLRTLFVVVFAAVLAVVLGLGIMVGSREALEAVRVLVPTTATTTPSTSPASEVPHAPPPP